MTDEQFTSIVHQWHDPLYRFALSLSRDSDKALDLTQNAFRKLARDFGSIRDLKKVKSWLFSVLHRDFIDSYRPAKRFPQNEFDYTHNPLPQPQATPLHEQQLKIATLATMAKVSPQNQNPYENTTSPTCNERPARCNSVRRTRVGE